MTKDRQMAARLIIEIMPKFMRSLASDWRHSQDSPSEGHFRALLILTRGPSNLGDLASQLEVSLPTMSNSISTLADRGWVKRQRDPEDRRRLLIELTPEGCAVLERIREYAEVHVERILAPLSDQECKQIIDAMNTLGQVFDADGLSCNVEQL